MVKLSFIAPIIVLIIAVTISLPVVCWLAYQLYNQWNAQWLIKRRRMIIVSVFIIVSCIMLGMLAIYNICR